ncbi:hypothetical protein OG819_46980 [Streptomyces sp. NBC_01549]|uniref:hypothetical protein n=1 Tax=unclassified Streptomyces TaxID=2593676 RepID=UPI002252BC22|nr:hypothetical protein [Streptomyces sp. NBC_01549]MCX4596913.1 hypothetical protein [Streptomyces sp. NBC_01549]
MAEIRSLEELQTPDSTALIFTPFGLGGAMPPERSAEFLQRLVADCVLAPDVAEGTRREFDRLQHLFPYGLLDYDVFTVVDDRALLVMEQALRERFVQWCAGAVTFEDANGLESPRSEDVRTYDDVLAAVKTLGRRSRRIPRQQPSPHWRLKVGSTLIDFNGMLAGLRTWARAAGLLRGQRTRGIEHAMSNLRNAVAHPTGYHRRMPVETARTLHDLAELINQLWGHPTPGGRLYPAPVERDIVVMAWNDEGSVHMAQADALRDDTDADGYLYLLIRSVSCPGSRFEDAYWAEFDARFETTQFPAEYLWGPGSRSDALAWLDAEQPKGDTVDYVDRVFMLREHDGQLYPPMHPEVAAGLTEGEQHGTWHTVRADFPEHAFTHVRGLNGSPNAHARTGDCRNCPAHHLGSGSHEQALRAAEDAIGVVTPRRPPAVRIPDSFFWPHRF